MTLGLVREPGSFRDPNGFIFYRNGEVFRQVQKAYKEDWDLLASSGLCADLQSAGLLVDHTEESLDLALSQDAYRVLRPQRIPFVSYPYEWCFSQLKDAALVTLDIQKRALQCGMSLKDASAYNIQFFNAKPVLIDTLSFERYREGMPWVAYRQFCQHFLAPLALMSKQDIRLGQMLRNNIDGIPLDLASRLLPRSTYLKPGILMHIHQHGAAQQRAIDQQVEQKKPAVQGRISKTALLGIVDSLEGTIKGLSWEPAGTTWSDYYGNTNYSDDAMEGKKGLVAALLESITPFPQTAWDLGANTGLFSRIASSMGIPTVSWDIDPAAVEKNYLQRKASGESNLLPLMADLTNPSPDLGWALTERSSLIRRGPTDVAFALALIHHLAIGNNVPLERIAAFLGSITQWLIIEFVPKNDTQVQRLLSARDDVFPDYNQDAFEKSFADQFRIVRREAVPQSERTLYLMQRITV